MALWLYYLCTFFAIILVRYFLVAGSAYWLARHLTPKSFEETAAKKFARHKLIKKDILLSVAAATATAICAAIIMTVYDSGATRIYSSTDEYGIWYLLGSFIAVILLQDASYYFFHRGFHHPLVYNWLHRGHHRSKNPTPWTSFALDFPEALIQGLFLVAIVLLIPIHIGILGLWLMTMTIWSLVNHLGFELFPRFPDLWLGKWLISSDHHSLHHRQYTRHFGLYFTFWDRLLGTN